MKKSFYLTSLFSCLLFSSLVFSNHPTPVELAFDGTMLMNCGDSFFDPGGENGDFQPGDSQVVTFCPDNPDDFIAVNFSEWDLGGCCDAVLEVHQGETLGNLLFTYDALNKPLTVSGFEPGCLTFNFIANANAVPAAGWEASVSCSACPPSIGHFTENISNEFILIFMETPFFGGNTIWEAGAPGFVPGTGEFAFSGMEFSEEVFLNGLESGVMYDVYVANICNYTDTSAFYGPIPIFSPPSCGDDFFDPSGPNGDITPNNFTVVSFCPDVPGQLLEVDFTSFDLGSPNNTLNLYDGEFLGGNLIGSYSGTNSPGMVSATNFSGCLSYELSVGSETVGFGWEASVSCITCPTPFDLTANQISSTSAQVSWSFIMPAEFYYFEVGLPGFEPGSNDFLASGNVVASNVFIPGLEGNTEYEFAVRSHCGQFDTSAFSQKILIKTSPSCGDVFYDPGGPSGNYNATQTVVNTICPDEPGTVVQLEFEAFELANNGSFFDIYDSNDPFGNLIGSWIGNEGPTVVSATNASGCLTTVFFPNFEPGPGWAANVHCVTCVPPNNVNYNGSDVGVEFFWSWVTGAASYHWEIGLPGFEPGTGNHVQQGTTNQTNIFGIIGLEGNTAYEFYVQSLCSGGDSSNFTGPVFFISPPGCSDPFYDNGGPNAPYEPFLTSTTTICPSEPNKFVQVVFQEMDVPSCCASLTVNDGLEFVQLNQNPGIPPPFTSHNPNGCLTFDFNPFNDLVVGDGWAATINCVSCPEPTNFRITRVTGETVRFNWQSLNVTLSVSWEVGLKGFAPGTGAAVATGTVPINFTDDLASGLIPNMVYEVYLKNICAGEHSIYAGPFVFRTAPTCDGQFFDPAGPDSSYVGNGISQLTVICPDEPDRYVEVEFEEFNVAPFFGDILNVYDDNDISSTTLGEFTDNNLPPLFSATNLTGCLAFEFNAFANESRPGWEANVTCVDCPRANLIEIAEIETDLIGITWNDIPAATQYFLEIGEKGFEPGTGEAIFTETLLGNVTSFEFTGLESGTFYDIYIRSDCNTVFSSFSQRLRVATQPTCGDFFYDPGGPNEQYPHNETYVTTICPNVQGDKVTVAFNLFSLESCCDFLNVFNGPNLFNSFIGSFSGSIAPDPITSSHSTGCLTFEFVSNNSIAGNGWEAVVNCGVSNSFEPIERGQFQLHVFPNPTSSFLHLVFDYPANETVEMEVHDIMGQRILQQPHTAVFGKNNSMLDMSGLPVGTYLVTVKGAQGRVTEKVVKM